MSGPEIGGDWVRVEVRLRWLHCGLLGASFTRLPLIWYLPYLDDAGSINNLIEDYFVLGVW